MPDLVVSIPTTELVYANQPVVVRICLLAKKHIKNIIVKHILTENIKIYDKGKGKVEKETIIFSPNEFEELKFLHSNYAHTLEYKVVFSKKIPVVDIIVDKDTVYIENLNEFDENYQETRIIVEYELYKSKKDKKRKKEQKIFTFQLATPMFEIMDPTKYGHYLSEEKLLIIPVRNVGDIDAYSTKIDVNLDYFAETFSGKIKFVTLDKHKNEFTFRISIKPLDIGLALQNINVDQSFEIDVFTRSNRPFLLACDTNPLEQSTKVIM